MTFAKLIFTLEKWRVSVHDIFFERQLVEWTSRRETILEVRHVVERDLFMYIELRRVYFERIWQTMIRRGNKINKQKHTHTHTIKSDQINYWNRIP